MFDNFAQIATAGHARLHRCGQDVLPRRSQQGRLEAYDPAQVHVPRPLDHKLFLSFLRVQLARLWPSRSILPSTWRRDFFISRWCPARHTAGARRDPKSLFRMYTLVLAVLAAVAVTCSAVGKDVVELTPANFDKTVLQSDEVRINVAIQSGVFAHTALCSSSSGWSSSLHHGLCWWLHQSVTELNAINSFSIHRASNILSVVHIFFHAMCAVACCTVYLYGRFFFHA